MHRHVALVAGLLAASLAACGGGTASHPQAGPTSPPPLPGGGAGTVTTRWSGPALPTKVLVVVLENHSQREALQQMPYLKELSARYGRTTAYRALAHPSLPNYLTIAGGSTFGIRDDRYPSSHPLRGASVFGQALAHHRTARTYAEAMPSSCRPSNSGRYAVRHNPWTYFADAAERDACRRLDVAMGGATSGALRYDTANGNLPNVGMAVPDVCSDGHDCSLATTDRWLRAWVPVWLSGPDFRTGRLAVVLTFDEDDLTQRNTVLTVVLHPRLRGSVVGAASDHLDLSAWLSRVAGATPLRSAAGRASLGKAFGLAGE